MRDKKLKVAVMWIGKNVLVRVLTRPESSRGDGLLFAVSNGFSLESKGTPSLSESVLVLAGGDMMGYDDMVLSCYCTSNMDAEQLVDNVEEVVKLYNKKMRPKKGYTKEPMYDSDWMVVK